MNKYLVFSLTLMMIFSLTACDTKSSDIQEIESTSPKTSSNTVETKAQETTSEETTRTEQNTSSETNKDLSENDGKEKVVTKQQTENYHKLISEKLFEEFYFDDSFKIVLEEYGDFNHDGMTEAVIGLNNPASGQAVSQIVYLKIVDDESLEILDQLDVTDYMDITDCKLISVKGIKNKVICINYSESQLSKDFILYELDANNIMASFSSFIGDEVETSLVDRDNDGIFDGFKATSYGHNTYYYNLYQEYEFYGDPYFGSRPISASVDIGDYPNQPKDVILEYVYLSDIKDGVRDDDLMLMPVKNLDQRIMGLSEVGYIGSEEYHYDSSLLKNTAIDIDPKLDYDIVITGNTATATAKIVGDLSDSNNVYISNLLDYELEYNESANKWYITSHIIVPYDSGTLNTPEDEVSTIDIYDQRLIWGNTLDAKSYEVEVDGEYKGELSLYNEVIYEDDSHIVVETYQLLDVDDTEHTNFLQDLSDERKFDWYFVEFFDGNHDYSGLAGSVYIMTENGFNEFMRTGELIENDDIRLVACDYPTEDILNDNQKGWHHFVEISHKNDVNPEIIYHGYNNTNETNYYERFIWKRGLGLIGYESGFGAEKDVLNLTLITTK